MVMEDEVELDWWLILWNHHRRGQEKVVDFVHRVTLVRI